MWDGLGSSTARSSRTSSGMIHPFALYLVLGTRWGLGGGFGPERLCGPNRGRLCTHQWIKASRGRSPSRTGISSLCPLLVLGLAVTLSSSLIFYACGFCFCCSSFIFRVSLPVEALQGLRTRTPGKLLLHCRLPRNPPSGRFRQVLQRTWALGSGLVCPHSSTLVTSGSRSFVIKQDYQC